MTADTPDPTPPSRRVAWASGLEDRFHRYRERRARKRGLVPTVVPYSGYGGDGWIRVLCRVLLTRPSTKTRSGKKSIRGWRSFVSIPVAHAAVIVRVDGQEFTVHADRGGVVDTEISATLTPGLRRISIDTDGSETVTADIYVVNPDARLGVLSDIDDTVMVTALPRPFLAAWNTFVLDEHARRPVPGMAVLLERITQEHPGSPVVYLSTGAWNIAPTLNRFMGRHLYPRGTLLLTDWGPTSDRLFRSGQEHKRDNLARLAREFPLVRWVLIGDDGQHDEALYREFAHEHPENVSAVAIRQLSTPEAVLAGGRRHVDAPEGAAPWVWAPDGAGLARKLAEVVLLRRSR